ncbi:SPOR domain-containing protein [Rufibacter ruber]|uniref:HU domain-containing protein n=1 Tax=Rufibacter ruber TaxID=1783499 RepID=UPI00082A6D88|nr:SPOR domain-containing protein [Rufibacter ruber]
MVQGHIKSLLYAYDCVIIPDFGGLITHYAHAKIHPVKHTFTPPSKRIAFNEQLQVNDGLLITTLAHRQQWPLAQAQQAVSEFVRDLKQQLQTQHRFELQDVGVFRYNAERKLVFESLEEENFLEHSFGLPELVSRPILGKETLVLRGKYADQTAGGTAEGKKPVSRLRRLYRVGASLVIGGLSLSAVYLYTLQADVALSSLNPFTLLSASAPAVPAVDSSAQISDLDAFDAQQLTEQYTSQLAEPTLEEELAAEDVLLADFPKSSPETETPKDDWAAAPQAKVEVAAAPVKAEKAAPAVVAPVAKVEKKVSAPAEVKENAATGSTIKTRTGRFYVIMGVFAQDGYAEMNQKRLQKKGYEAKIVVTAHDRKRQRVSVADYSTAEEAQAALPALRSKISQELWVLNY